MLSFPSALKGQKKQIRVVNRATGELFDEIVFSEDAMRVFYGSELGFTLTSKFLTNPWVSKLYGAYNDSGASKHKIEEFIQELGIDASECERELAEYQSFNDFFARKLKPGSRPIDQDPNVLISPGDGRIHVFPELKGDQLAYVKWANVSLFELFGQNQALTQRYQGGAAFVLRLCPSDYHRFHFPASGRVSITKTIDGALHSVSPYAIESNIPVFCLNKRTICEIDSDHFGKIVCMEVGALMVGSIVQTYRPGMKVNKGDEKGYFKFGGSTTIAFFEPGRITFDSDLISNTHETFETLVKMGEHIGSRAS